MNLDGTPSRAVQDLSTYSETCRFRIGASVPISHADRKGPPGITPRAGFIHPKIRASSRLIVAPRRACECGAPVTDTGGKGRQHEPTRALPRQKDRARGFRVGALPRSRYADRNGPPGITPRAGFIADGSKHEMMPQLFCL